MKSFRGPNNPCLWLLLLFSSRFCCLPYLTYSQHLLKTIPFLRSLTWIICTSLEATILHLAVRFLSSFKPHTSEFWIYALFSTSLLLFTLWLTLIRPVLFVLHHLCWMIVFATFLSNLLSFPSTQSRWQFMHFCQILFCRFYCNLFIFTSRK